MCLLFAAPALLERHARGAPRTLGCSPRSAASPQQAPAALAAGPQPPLKPLSDAGIRVLRYLLTNLSISDIASELYVSPNTGKTHIRHLYGKLGTHRRG